MPDDPPERPLTFIKGEKGPDPVEPSREVLAGFWAVVMASEWSGTYLWSLEGWRRHSDSGAGFRRTPGEIPTFDPEHVEAVEAVAASFARTLCRRCDLGVDQHLVAPDPWGVPTQYCVQRQNESVIGGGGTMKHVASVNPTCRAVDWVGWRITVPRPDPFSDPVLEPQFAGTLAASEIRDRDWCSRCLPRQDQPATRQYEMKWTKHYATVFWTNAKLAGTPRVVLPGEGF